MIPSLFTHGHLGSAPFVPHTLIH